MSPIESTQPTDLERPNGSNGGSASSRETGDAWSFGRARLLAPLRSQPKAAEVRERSAAANVTGTPTVTPTDRLDPADLSPVAVARPVFGKRGFAPLYQWEGVVEEVNGDGFRARLFPVEDGHAHAARVEYADFAYDDLADESDHELVRRDAVFYWTVGKSRNAAGTYTNTSLVRFRRLPPATQYQARQASRDADALLADLGGD
jgi:hypothetical protein